MNTIAIRLAKQCILASVIMLPAYAVAQQNQPSNAVAEVEIEPLEDSSVSGSMTLQQQGQAVAIKGTVNGLRPGKKHGFHVHEGRDCDDRGPHFSPHNAPHGAPQNPEDRRHLGDLGNLDASADGTANYSRAVRGISLTGPDSVVGRVMVVHIGEDDLTSQPSGKSGEQIACGVIRLTRQ